jgi:hypothetical protein
LYFSSIKLISTGEASISLVDSFEVNPVETQYWCEKGLDRNEVCQQNLCYAIIGVDGGLNLVVHPERE